MQEYETSLWDHEVDKGCISINCAAMVGSRIVEDLKELHKLGYLHLDIKPDNIMICKETSSVVLIDFGNTQYYLLEDKKSTRVQ